jgi:hypothetical protein
MNYAPTNNLLFLKCFASTENDDESPGLTGQNENMPLRLLLYIAHVFEKIVDMLLTEWNMEDALRVRGEEERELGFAEGEKRAARANAARMKSDGLDIKLIVKYTGLKPDEIEKL